MSEPLRVLGVDTSLRSTGVAVVEATGSKFSSVDYGTVKTPQSRSHSECLGNLHQSLSQWLDRTSPNCVAIEGGFYSRNPKTAMVLGEARGVVIGLCAVRGLNIYEYAPRKVKLAATGYGSASKEQVRGMIMKLLGLDEEPQEDAGDALAIALCHLHNVSGIAALAPNPI